MAKAFERASGKDIPCKIVERREGDIAECYADPSLAELELDWIAEKNFQQMCDDAWRWQQQNLNGLVKS